MTRLKLLLSLALLCSCDQPTPSDPALDEGAGASSALPEELARRAATTARAFRGVDGGFEASGHGMLARIDEHGLVVESAGEGLALTLTGLGRDAGESALGPVQPALGACTDDVELSGDCARRVELDRGGVVEWWVMNARGLEQGFDLVDRPDGDGPLRLLLRAEGASVEGDATGEQLWLTDSSGQRWFYGEIDAWDADGQPLEATLDPSAQGLTLTVDDQGARYPITVDPLMKTAAKSWTGSGTDMLGDAVAGHGDLNGDGYGDFAIGAPGASSGTGKVYVFYGSASGPSSSADVTLTGPDASSAFGKALAMDGSVNGDAYADLVVGAPNDTITASAQGAVYVFHGSSTGLSSTYTTRLTGSATASALFGSAVDITGDVNKDGYADVLVGEYGYSSSTGRAWIFAGSTSGASTSTFKTLTPTTTSGVQLGFAVNGGGDYNGDGYADFAIGAPEFNTGSPTHTGRIWIYAGSGTFFTGTPAAATFYGGTSGYRYGYAVNLEGSYNGDTATDLVVGAATGASTAKGRIYYYQTASGALPSGATRNWDGPSVNSYYGAWLSWAGDVNKDSYQELLIGAPYDSTDVGYVSLHNGGSTGITSTTSTTFTGSSGYLLGDSVAGVGDVNGDGYQDALLGAPGYSSSAGLATLRYGGVDSDSDGYVDNGTGTLEDCNDASSTINPAATEVCDASNVDEDCDGKADDDDSSVSSTGKSTWYADTDGDGYGDLSSTKSACDKPTGYVSNSTDCNDVSSAINPGATEVCDSAHTDEDCDGVADDDDSSTSSSGKTTYYADSDSDTYGAGSGISRCDKPSGYVTDDTDCDDASSAINPSATEVCDASNTDEDCDGLADDDDSSVSSSGETTYYADGDSDGYGAGSGLSRCDQPSGYVTDDTDCDDASAGVNPGASEVCDASNTDEDCDGVADNDDSSAASSGKSSFYTDTDRDGYGGSVVIRACDALSGTYATSTDCDDSNAAINPGATEVCDASDTDEDCDGLADDDDPGVASSGKSTYYADADSDGYGDAATTRSACDLPSGYGTDDTDCDDSSAAVNPGAAEVCDASDTDEDCDGVADNDDSSAASSGKSSFYTDTDRDGYGGSVVIRACDALSGTYATSTDCDDSNAAINPGAAEICDSSDTDEDCDGLADDDDPGAATSGMTIWYTDADADGYGSSSGTLACDAPGSTVADHTDCDDTDDAIHPGASEVCDPASADEDCDGLADDDDTSVSAIGKSSFYVDADGDSYGTGTALRACHLPEGYAARSADCDDGDDAINPGATEICDSADTDEDCDGLADDDDSSVAGSGKTTYYADVDSDGYGSDTSLSACDLPSGYVADTTDCDDTKGAIHPGATEVCDSADTDEDCDGLADDADPGVSSSGKSTYYADDDHDGYGDAGSVSSACDQPSGTVTDATDCDDGSGAVHPGATEVCDSADTDEDCDGLADDSDPSTSSASKSTWYTDTDRDGYGVTGSSSRACEQPSDAVATSGDCDDTSPLVNPGANEICDSADTDEDCDGKADDADTSVDVSTTDTWYTDADGDGYGDDSTAVARCDAPSSTVAIGGDCDDSDDAYYPSASESCTDPNDYNCDGEVGYADGDSDGFAACEDCDDGDAEVNPDAVELCDDIDDDCDGTVDEDSAADAPSWYGDGDGDGYGDASDAVTACAAPDGTVALGTDCDDTSVAYHPGASESCDDPNDYDCDGSVSYADADHDGYAACEDCDDTNAGANAGETETCDGIDDDCDGEVDEDSATDAGTWYADDDDDGYGDASVSVLACSAPAGYVALATDCDDGDARYNPAASESCADPNDYNCDGSVGYADADADGYAACEECDDTNAGVSPSATETCDGIDDDCDGEVDEDSATDASTWYADSDSDGYGDPDVSTISCAAPEGYVALGDDCDDSSALYNPSATETCTDPNDYNCDGSVGYADADHDGYAACEECDDTNAGVSPTATEACNGIDDDCDGEVDEDSATDASTWYADSDDDGYGDPDVSTVSCAAPDGYVALSDDCDDSSGLFHPDASESCTDPNDYNCDGSVGYADEDGDGYAACEECDDTNAGVSPTAIETCDGIDDDCDGEVDEDSATDASIWYADNDDDGYGDASEAVVACSAPDGYVALSDDCDDSSALYNPGASETCTDPSDYNCDGSVGYADEDGDGYAACEECDDTNSGISPASDELCNGVDDNCDGEVDEDSATDASTWYADSDDDGYGDPDLSVVACTAPDGYVALSDDCDDSSALYNPGASESCTDANDYNCDGSVGYADADADGYAACEECDDTNANVSPSATETCNGIDDNCDGEVDEDSATDASTWYADSDDDGYGDPDFSVVACTAPDGYVALSDDCDDSSALYNPSASESCDDPNDYNCDGSVGYADADADGYAACEECDDTNASISPTSDELCNGVDDNCDGEADEDSATDAGTWYADSDDDGYGDPDLSVVACTAPSGYVALSDDCDDSSALYNPGASESCDDPNDYNCDGSVGYADADDDGYAACEECDDTNAAVNPAASESCDGIDDNCDGIVDEDSAIDAGTWYADDDDDGYGDDGDAVIACDAPSGYVDVGGDCDDADGLFHPDATESCDDPNDYNCDGSVGYADSDDDGYVACEECDDGDAAVNPGATEVCDEVDNDCDGGIDVGAADAATWYVDGDDDGYGDEATTEVSCDQPEGYGAEAGDCDDANASISPAAAEVCDDTVDNDCDGAADGDDDACTEGDSADTGDSGDTGGAADDTGGTGKDKTCGCATGSAPSSLGFGLLALVALSRRRRRAA